MNSKYIYTYVRTSRPCLSEIARGNENFKRSPDIKYQGFQDRCPPPLTRFRVRDRTRIELVVLVLVVVLVAVVGKSMCARVCVCVCLVVRLEYWRRYARHCPVREEEDLGRKVEEI